MAAAMPNYVAWRASRARCSGVRSGIRWVIDSTLYCQPGNALATRAASDASASTNIDPATVRRTVTPKSLAVFFAAATSFGSTLNGK